MSCQPKSELIHLTDHVSVIEDQLLGNDLPELEAINLLKGVMGLRGTPSNSMIGLYAADVPVDQVKACVDPDTEDSHVSSIDRLYRRSGLAHW